MKYKVSLFAILLMALEIPSSVFAYDFSATAPTGQTLFYTIVNGSSVSVTYPSSAPWNPYNGFTQPTGDLEIPSWVHHNGSTYFVTSIGDYSFQGCNLTSVTIGNYVTSIGVCAFYGCYTLTSLTIGDSVSSIGYEAFAGCRALASIEVLNGNTVYDSRDNCNAIIETASNTLIVGCKNTTIPNSVISIGRSAFCGCSDLTSVAIPNSITSIGNSAFSNCYNLTSVDIPNAVTLIGNEAFYCCTGLTLLTIPNSVTSIGELAFAFCLGLASIEVASGNTVYDSRDNCNAIIETASNTLIAGCKNTTIPNSVTSIGYASFWGCINLTSLTIPNSVTSIGDVAFQNCGGLTSLTIGNSVTTIGDFTFWGCIGLTSLTIPNSVTEIGDRAFCYCTGLEMITSLATIPPTTNASCFDSVDSFIPVYVPCASVEAYQAAEGWNVFSNIICHTEGIGDVDGAGAKVYIHSGQIVVEGAEGNTVWLYDAVGRLLATRQDDYSALRFEVPATGTYLIKVGNHPARRVVVVR